MITLPLTQDINRCLAHGLMQGQSCHLADRCARHVTIRHDAAPVPASYRACSTDDMNLLIPIEGFPKEDEA